MKNVTLHYLKIFFFTLSLLFTDRMYSQVIAGDIPSGGFLIDPDFNFSVFNSYEDTSGTLDLNCDNIADLEVQLVRGQSAVDDPNSVFLRILNPAFGVIADTGLTGVKFIRYYNLSDLLVPVSGSSWTNDSLYLLGNFGCLLCIGPWDITDKFIAYTNGINVGWIRISFHITDSGSVAPITLTMHQVLSYCLPNSVNENLSSESFVISPNPVAGNSEVKIYSDEEIKEVELFDATGRKVFSVFNAASGILGLPVCPECIMCGLKIPTDLSSRIS